MKTILIVGDSFTYGQGCSDCRAGDVANSYPDFDKPSVHAWPALLQETLCDDRIINASRPGNSLGGMFIDILKYCEHNTIDLIVYSGTHSARMPMPDYRNWTMHVMEDDNPNVTRAKEYYLKYMTNELLIDTNAYAYFMAAYGYARAREIPFVYSLPEPNLCNHMPKADGRFDSMMTVSFPDNYYTDTTVFKFDPHPNEAAHMQYYQDVIAKTILPMVQSL